jgi:hypothetical protein
VAHDPEAINTNDEQGVVLHDNMERRCPRSFTGSLFVGPGSLFVGRANVRER